ncbi:ABC transporter permease [Anaerosporobacter faecicola]|uniref:ABC transporter permease n=1 Tax=Anaerosporobacter faecicola TaxID=2718714 RepID=UPI00143C649F|nr:ABC transporter permease [Anaerosporobacter faecicola]
MWKKKLRQKKYQFLLIGIVLFVTTAIFAGCISFTLETTRFGQDFFKSETCPDMIYLTRSADSEQLLKQTSDVMNDVDTLFAQSAKYITAGMYVDDKAINVTFNSCMALNNVEEIPYYFERVKGATKDLAPKNHEVWISQAFADDNNIEVGDTIFLRSSYECMLTVTVLYNSAPVPSGMMGIFPMFVSQETLNSIDEPDATYITLQFKDGIKSIPNECYPEEFMSNLYYSIDVAGINMTYSTASMLFGGIGTIASLIIFLVSVILIRFILRSSLLREYRSIGIYKSLGYTSKKIIRFYLNCYAFVGVFAIPLGILGGIPLAYLLGGITNKYLTGYHITSTSILAAVLTFVILMLILLGNVYAILRTIPKITPIKALSIGATSSKEKLKRSLIPSAHSPFSMAINMIWKKKSLSVMVVLVLSVSFYLILLFGSISHTCSTLESHLDVWFGIPRTSCSIAADVTDDVRSYLTDNPYVKKVIFGDLSIRATTFVSNTTGNDLSADPIFSYESFEDPVVSFTYAKGRPPKNPLEIGITSDMSKEIGGTVGDYVNLTINDYTGDFLITGIFSSLMQGGHNLHILPVDLDRCHITYHFDNSMIQLKEGVSFEEFQDYVQETKPELQVVSYMPGLKSAVISVKNLSKPVTFTLVIVFILFSILNIINLMMMNNLENRKQYGILKALGFTNRYICAQNMFRTLILSTIAAIFAQVLDLLFSKILFANLVGIDALICPFTLRLGVTFSMMVLILFITYLFTLPVKKISPKELMEE